jgi:uncharacterized membrane protein YhaH (DUF805 family)
VSVENPFQAPQTPIVSGHLQPVKRNLMWLLFSVRGRIPRRVFWGANLLLGVLFYALFIPVLYFMKEESDAQGAAILLVSLFLAWPSICISTKRWHDRGHSGWMMLFGFIPVIGSLFVFFATGCFRGTVGPNRYGPDPT